MKKWLLVTTLISTPAYADDPFYIGVFAGAGASHMSNTLIQGGVIVGEFPTTGLTAGTLAGITIGYGQLSGFVYWGLAFEGAYDFARSCFSLDCDTERHPGWLLQQVAELGISPFGWSNTIIAIRGGYAERTNNICAFNLPNLTRDCGSGWVGAPDLGLKLAFKVTANSKIFLTYDHIGFRYSASAQLPASSPFQDFSSIKGEEVAKIGYAYQFSF